MALAMAGTCWLAAMPGSALATSVDRSFGINGSVSIDPVLAGYQTGYVPDIATGPRGGIYLLTRASKCSPCVTDLFVTRLRPDGTRDASYGLVNGRAPVPSIAWESASIAVDSRERQIVVAQLENRIVVTRLTPGGAVDRSFGGDGEVSRACDCEYMSFHVAVGRRDRIEIFGNWFAAAAEDFAYRLLLLRLRSSGRPDTRFGVAGKVVATIDEGSGPTGFATMTNGATIVAGANCCSPKPRPYLRRFGPRGRPDRRFDARARRAIRSLRTPKHKRPESVTTVVPRRGGEFDLLGSAFKGGFVLRFLGDGRIDRSFGDRGIRSTRWPVYSAASDRAGHVLGLGSDVGNAVAFWLGQGRVRGPVVRLGGLDPLSTAVVMQGRRPLLFFPDPPECRGYCPPHPRLVRLEPWAR